MIIDRGEYFGNGSLKARGEHLPIHWVEGLNKSWGHLKRKLN